VSTTTGPLDQAQIEMLRSLDDGEGAALAEIVTEYLTVAEQGRVDLFGALGRQDADTVARTAHILKGASANVGAAHLAETCGEIERHARQDTLRDLGATFGLFEAEFERVSEALRVLLARA
jgi:HPt (histidine-containing phosphotransfer) domain-containing protein